mgnify:CR=1 FL=1
MSKKFNGHRCERRNMSESILGVRFNSLGQGTRVQSNKTNATARPMNYVENP